MNHFCGTSSSRDIGGQQKNKMAKPFFNLVGPNRPLSAGPAYQKINCPSPKEKGEVFNVTKVNSE